VAGSEIVVLTRAGIPAGVGELGQVHVRSRFLSDGYVGEPQLTGDRFAAEGPGEPRSFATGDLARPRPDGSFDFCGRRDRQHKVRGFRVECAEIELHLRRHPLLADAWATVAERNGGSDVVAYAVPANPADRPTAEELRAFAANVLPDHMVPSQLAVVPSLPTTRNGKIDLAPLHALLAGPPPASSSGVIDEVVAHAWQHAIGSGNVDPDANFFDLGGNSLLLVTVQERLVRELGREIPLMLLFKHTTIRSLSAALCGAGAASPDERAARSPSRSEDRRGQVEARRRRVDARRSFASTRTPEGMGAGAVPDSHEARRAARSGRTATATDRWRIAILSMALPATRILHALAEAYGHEVVALLTPPPRPEAESRKRFLELVATPPEGLDVAVVHEPDDLERHLRAVEPDLALCYGFPWLIPREALEIPRLGVVNTHPSLLPRHRGPCPLAWMFRSGDDAIGLTFHHMDERFDTGPILAQASRPLDEEDYLPDVETKLAELSAALLPTVFERLARGEPGDPQPEGATYAGPFEDDYVPVDWSRPRRMIHDQVRAWPVAASSSERRGPLTELRGEEVRLLRTSLRPRVRALEVQAGDGPVWVVQTEPAGES
jgi:methionyl-tRNA formyltransferase